MWKKGYFQLLASEKSFFSKMDKTAVFYMSRPFQKHIISKNWAIGAFCTSQKVCIPLCYHNLTFKIRRLLRYGLIST